MEAQYYAGIGWGIEMMVLINGKAQLHKHKAARHHRLQLLDSRTLYPSALDPNDLDLLNHPHFLHSHNRQLQTGSQQHTIGRAGSRSSGSAGYQYQRAIEVPRSTYSEFVDRVRDPTCHIGLASLYSLAARLGISPSFFIAAIAMRLDHPRVLRDVVANSIDSRDGLYLS
jgi:hypothetical protein